MDEWMTGLAPHLRALVELADQDGHMTEAAAALGIPQSSMSRRIHALEEKLNSPLLIREGRTVRLTASAQQLAQRARGPLRDLELTVASFADDADPDHGVVRFGFPLTMGSGTVPDLLAAFNRRHPGIRLQLKQAHGSALADDLRLGSLDLAITIPPPVDLPHTVLSQQRICALVPVSHRLAGRSRIALQNLASDIFIANPPSYNLRTLTDFWCRSAGFEPDIRIEITEFATIRELVSRGLGVALLPPAERVIDGAVDVPLSGDVHRRSVALTSASSILSPATRRLRDFVLANGID